MSGFESCQTAIELFKVIFNHGGSMELGSAFAKLSARRREEALSMSGKSSKFVAKFPKHFVIKREASGKVQVEVSLPLEFCPNVGKKPGCTIRDCQKLHLCTHFIMGTCTFGEKCRKSHCIDDQHTQRILHATRLEFTMLDPGVLLELLRKRFKESEIQITATRRDMPEICKHYTHQNGCSKGATCAFLHVCNYYIEGECKFKSECKREHSFKDAHNQKVLKVYSMHKLHESQILACLRGRQGTGRRTLSSSSDSSHPDTSACHPSSAPPRITGSPNGKAKDICGFHLRGKCNYGDKCMNHHTELPYLWEYSKEVAGNASWEGFLDDLNMMVEEAFCDVAKDSFPISVKGSRFAIQFDEMIAKPVAG